MRLKRKQITDNASWISAVATAQEAVTREELDNLVKSTVENIRDTVGAQRAAYAWSGGKDSIVLGKLCEMAGVTDSMIALCNLEYPSFLKWVMEHKPEGCEVINTGQNLDWLVKHPEMLFPGDCKMTGRWFSIVQHNAQRIYFQTHKLDVLILGRRRADGNYVGRGTNIYTDGKGITRYSPLADWRHEDILAFISYYGLELPPIYEWKNGYTCGTHPWPARPKAGSVGNGWREVYEIDPTIVAAAAEKIESARDFLKEVQA